MKPYILLATPSYNREFDHSYIQSLFATQFDLNGNGIPFKIYPLFGNCYVTQVRSIQCALLLSDPELSHIMWVDADMAWPGHAVRQLLSHDKDIVGGPYLSRHADKWNFRRILNQQLEGPLVETEGCGTGFLLVKREVIQNLSDACGDRWFHYHVMDQKLEVRDIFRTDIVANHDFQSDDYAFCSDAMRYGYKVYLDHTLGGIAHYRGEMTVGDITLLRDELDRIAAGEPLGECD